MHTFLRNTFLFLLTVTRLTAQQAGEPIFQQLGKEKLPDEPAYFQHWDKQGRMWMASENGIVYFDGYTSQKLKHKPGDANSPLSNNIRSVYIDERSDLWVCYGDLFGISRYQVFENRFTHYPADTLNKGGFPPFRVSGFREDSKGNFWISTWGSGLVKMDRDKGTFKIYTRDKNAPDGSRTIPCNVVKGFQELPDGRVLLGFFDEKNPKADPCYFDPVKETFTPFPLAEYLTGIDAEEVFQISAAIKITNFIYRDEYENLWFGTYSCLIHLDTRNKIASRVTGKQFIKSQNNLENARNYAVDESGRLWIATTNSGVMLVNVLTKDVRYLTFKIGQETSIADNHILTVRKDPEENIWISTESGAFSIYNPRLQQFSICPWENMKLDFSNRSQQPIPVNQMLISPDGKIYASNENGISVYDPENQRLIKNIVPKKVASDVNPRVGNFKTLDNGQMLAITTGGAALLDTAPDRLQLLKCVDDRKLLNILFRHQGDHEKLFCQDYLSFTNTSRIYEVDKPAGRLNLFATLKGFEIRETYSFILPDGRWMIAGGERAFAIFNPADKSFKVYGPDKREGYFPDSTITSAMLTPAGEVWIGSANGLYAFDYKTGKAKLLNSKIGIGRETVNTMIIDKQGIAWFAMADDILMWDAKNDKRYRFGNILGARLGRFMPSVAQTDNAGKIYMASMNGVVVFNPRRIMIPRLQPKLFLKQVLIAEDTLSGEQRDAFTKGDAHLAWNENFLTFEVRPSQIYAPTPHRFYYRLVGLDTTWLDNGISNRFRFTSLDHGDYVLEVKVINAYGREGELFRLPFAIGRPFWTTWWFVLLLLGVALMVIVYVIRYRERASRAYKEKLETEIHERTAEVVQNAEKIKVQKEIIEEKNKELTDSIHYAQRIQQSILPERQTMLAGLPDHFIFYQPKAIVSGDFYWYSDHAGAVLWAVVDCTGHGVPGGFMSMLGSGLLNQIVNEERITDPAEILNRLRDRVIQALKQKGNFGESSDGMDITLCRFHPQTRMLAYAGANTPVYIIRKGEVTDLRPDKQPIGIYAGHVKPFTTQELQLEKGDLIYMSSDGYADQFGGEKGKKFKTSNFVKLLAELAPESTAVQQQKLAQHFRDWKGNYEQVDDICVIGVRVL